MIKLIYTTKNFSVAMMLCLISLKLFAPFSLQTRNIQDQLTASCSRLVNNFNTYSYSIMDAYQYCSKTDWFQPLNQFSTIKLRAWWDNCLATSFIYRHWFWCFCWNNPSQCFTTLPFYIWATSKKLIQIPVLRNIFSGGDLVLLINTWKPSLQNCIRALWVCVRFYTYWF